MFDTDHAWTLSDAKIKKDIESLPDSYSLLFDELNPVRYKLISGTSGRYHTGFIAQDVLTALTDCGMDTIDFAAYIEDQKSGSCGIRYEELIPLLVNEIQKLKKRVNDLEKK